MCTNLHRVLVMSRSFLTDLLRFLFQACEAAAQIHFKPICDDSGGMMRRLWQSDGGGKPRGTAPYHVCLRAMPHVAGGGLPHGWQRKF